jgi:hypothetical protein
MYMGDDTILEAIAKGSIKATMQVGGKMLLIIQSSLKFFMCSKWKIISFPLTNSFKKAWKWSLTRMVVRWTMSMELSSWKHGKRKTCTFSMLMLEKENVTCKDFEWRSYALAPKTWPTQHGEFHRSWKKWLMAWTWKKCHYIMCVKLA